MLIHTHDADRHDDMEHTEQGSEPYFGTSQLNNKRAGYGGGGWHSHHIGGGVDFLPQPCTDIAEYHSAALTSLTLACQMPHSSIPP